MVTAGVVLLFVGIFLSVLGVIGVYGDSTFDTSMKAAVITLVSAATALIVVGHIG